MTDAPRVRMVLFERDADTDARSVTDIVEFEAPPRIEGRPTFTALSKDARRREIMVMLARQVDELLTGRADEIVVCLSR